MPPIIQVQNLSKAYRLGQIGRTSLKEEINRWWGRLRGRHSAAEEEEQGLFWALKDINFEVNEGEVLGVIGKNGAGKSTLLKILSRITEPTSGKAIMRGRVSSLLEVGTGFHPDLTGRENIYLNGSMLGMSRNEIRRKFDEIVAFAEIEQFIDTPVKRYSSGMYVRLAFAVAAHLEPEILIVDEVLAVGDASFQKKCMGKMQEVSKGEGRTILFVSHNMNSIERLCNRALVLKNGSTLCLENNVEEAIRQYHMLSKRNRLDSFWENKDGDFNNSWFIPSRLYLTNEDGSFASSTVRGDENVWINIDGELLQDDSSLQIGYGLIDPSGALMYWSTHRDLGEFELGKNGNGKITLRSRLPLEWLNEAEYRLDLFLGCYHREWVSEPNRTVASLRFELKGGLSKSPLWTSRRPGYLAPNLEWQNHHKI